MDQQMQKISRNNMYKTNGIIIIIRGQEFY